MAIIYQREGGTVTSHYIIHACNQRMWYVKDFLIPSMLEQGIPQGNIWVYQDKNGIGNLRAWIDSSNRIVNMCRERRIKSVWHLQDDICISRTFAHDTNIYDLFGDDETIVCGFTCAYDKMPEAGNFEVHENKMWYSFPCIKIPTYILDAFVNWANLNLWQSQYFRGWVNKNKGDDLIFREWLIDNFPCTKVQNLAPNLVNHIDDLIGGTICNKQRDTKKSTRSIFWEDDELIKELEERLNEYKLSGT